MRSMTGFGVGSAALGPGSVRLEIRALNHRYQDIRLRLPGELGEHSFFVEQLARKHLGRGRFDLSAHREGSAQGAPQLSLDKATALYASVLQLRDRVAPGSDVPLASILTLPGVLETSAPDPEAVRACLEAAFRAALLELERMREEEGAALLRELQSRLELSKRLVAELGASTADLVAHHQARLRERVARLLADVGAALNQDRLEQEIALLADKSDITEELVRLGSHFAQMAALFSSDEPSGRKLDFLLQEVGREINTVGSKSQHAPLAHLVVELKAEMERMREQVQNVD